MRDSTVFYRSFYEAVKDLPPEDFKKSVCAIMDYALNGITPDTTGIEKTMYIMAKPQIDANNRRYENSKHGGRKPKPKQDQTKTEPDQNQVETKLKPNQSQTATKSEPNVNANGNDNGEKESVKKKHFVPPTRQDVEAYCREKGICNVDADRFVDYYASNGWMTGRNKMKDWKAAVRNWARSESATKPNNTRGNRLTNFSNQRTYDYGQLEKQLLGGGANGQGR